MTDTTSATLLLHLGDEEWLRTVAPHTHSQFLSSLLYQLYTRGTLTPRQLDALRRCRQEWTDRYRKGLERQGRK